MLTIDGKVPGNLFQLQDSNAGLRSFAAQKQTVDIDKPLSEQFRLYIKHPAAFTALWHPPVRSLSPFCLHPFTAGGSGLMEHCGHPDKPGQAADG